MDNLPHLDGKAFDEADTAPDYAHYDEEGEDEAIETPIIGQDERRMHVRAYNFWAGLLGERKYPDVEDLAPEEDVDFGPNSVLLDFTGGIENPAIQYLGDALRAECEIDGRIDTIDDVPARSLLSRITDHYLQIIANEAPIGFEAEFVNQRGATIMYRGILLPFSTNDEEIDFIYGVINWKECASDEVAAGLKIEVEQAMRSAPEKREAGPVWADSPTAEQDADPVLELSADMVEAPSEIPAAQMGEDAGLADWLEAARAGAAEAETLAQRSRSALYTAIGQAYDFYLQTERHPQDYAEMLADNSLEVQDRAPMTPIVKLVFGIDYDKTRLTEYACVLRHAVSQGIGQGELADYVEKYNGGLKAIVRDERQARNGPTAASVSGDPVADVRAKLRAAPARALSDIEAGNDEFVVLVARRNGEGGLEIVGPAKGTRSWTEAALGKVVV